MNKENYKSAMSGVRHSDELTERILMDMTKLNAKKRMNLKPLLAAAACLLLIVTGIFGGIAINGRLNRVKPSANLFTLTAYAQGESINLKDSPLVKTDLKLEYSDGDAGDFLVAATTTGFRFEGNNVKTVTFSALRGEISYAVTNLNGNGNNVKATHNKAPDRTVAPFADSLTLDFGKDDIVDVKYYPSEAVDIMMHAEEKMGDLSVLPEDTINITVIFTDGTTADAAIQTSFDKDGNMQLAYQE